MFLSFHSGAGRVCDPMIGKVLFEEFFSNRDWPVASAVAVILLIILIIPIILFQRNEQRQQEAER